MATGVCNLSLKPKAVADFKGDSSGRRAAAARTGAGSDAAAGGDHRSQERVEHPVRQLVGQRLFGLVLGYEDLNDHDELRDDSLLTLAVDDLTGENRGRDRGRPLAPEPAYCPSSVDVNSRKTIGSLSPSFPEHKA